MQKASLRRWWTDDDVTFEQMHTMSDSLRRVSKVTLLTFTSGMIVTGSVTSLYKIRPLPRSVNFLATAWPLRPKPRIPTVQFSIYWWQLHAGVEFEFELDHSALFVVTVESENEEYFHCMIWNRCSVIHVFYSHFPSSEWVFCLGLYYTLNGPPEIKFWYDYKI